MRAETEQRGIPPNDAGQISESGIPDTDHGHDFFTCHRWRCTMSKRVCIARRQLSRKHINHFTSATDPIAFITFQSCARCDQGDEIGREFGIAPPVKQPRPTTKRCNVCGVVKPVGAFYRAAYRYEGVKEDRCVECKLAYGVKYRKRKRLKAQG